MPNATQIAAYTYKTETLCPNCAVEQYSELPVHQLAIDAELYFDQAAKMFGIDRYDERSFDSSDFPKVVFTSQLDTLDHFPHDCGYEHGCTGCLAEKCDHCGKEL